jgi:hypothetical protein
MMNAEEPMITVMQHQVTGEYTIHVNNFDCDSSEGYTEQEVEDLIIHLQRGIRHLNNFREESDYTQMLFGKDSLYAEENPESR